MISSNSVPNPGHIVAKARPIALHRSALTEDEYDYYMSALSDLSPQSFGVFPQDHMGKKDFSLESKVLTLREARAWLRGRFHTVPCAMVDEILRLFPGPLTGEKYLTDAQFLAALRLTCHAQNGMTELDKSLTFQPASITLPTSFGTAGPPKDGLHDQIAATSPVNEYHNGDVFKSAASQGLSQKRSGRTKVGENAVPATPNPTPAATKAPSKKIVPEKRAIDVESEGDSDDDDRSANAVKKPQRNTQSVPPIEPKAQETESPAKKARRTNAGKRKSDTTWEDTAANPKSVTRPQNSVKSSPAAPLPTAAIKPATTTATGPLTQRTIKKPFHYATTPVSMPLPSNTRIIRAPILSQVAVRTKNPNLQGDGKDASDYESADSYVVLKPRAKVSANVTPDPDSEPAQKPQSKNKPDERNSDEDPNKTKSDSSSASGESDSGSDAEKNPVMKFKATTPGRPAVVASLAQKPTNSSGTTNAPFGSVSASTARSKKTNLASDGFSRPPPNKDGAYTIDRIAGSHTSPAGAVKLRVVWAGYPESEATWEPLAGVKGTEAYARWTAMWSRLGKKGIEDVQIVGNMKNTLEIDGRMREHKLVQAVGTKVKEAEWVPTKEAQGKMDRIKQAILEDESMMVRRV